ncbi:hypothetical protein GGR54DRAFT_634993 [Hypoxylon sp. NC1633]|nr:hypothetical protein GGR54DRAFT_634993 [Hypoxylon sp. NC1633]
MEHRYFMPSEQLTGNAKQARHDGQVNNNYRGDSRLHSNVGANVPEEKNTSLWVTGLPAKTTLQSVLAAITKTGNVRSAVLNGPDESHTTAAAAISFFTRQAAQTLFQKWQRGEFTVNGVRPIVMWNRNRVAEEERHSYRSRVLLIAGDPAIVNRDYLDWFFSSKFVYQIDQIINHGIVSGSEGPIARLEYRFGSFRSQAESARMALSMELAGFLLTSYGEDPCAV